MTDTVNQYRIYCNTEEAWVYSWGVNPPTTCSNNTGHSVNSSSVSITDILTRNEISIKPTDTPLNQQAVGKNYRMKSQAFTANGLSTTTSTWSIPYPIAIISGHLHVDDDYIGDSISIGASYDTTIGAIAQNVAQNDTVIYTSAQTLAIPYVRIGGHVRFTNGSTTTIYYEIVSIDKVANTFTLNSGISSSFNAATPTYIQIAVIFCDNITIGPADGVYRVGSTSFGASYVPKNAVFRITYTNTSLTSKTPVFIYDFYY